MSAGPWAPGNACTTPLGSGRKAFHSCPLGHYTGARRRLGCRGGSRMASSVASRHPRGVQTRGASWQAAAVGSLAPGYFEVRGEGVCPKTSCFVAGRPAAGSWEIRPGDVAWTPPGAEHRHGATATSGMTHIAIQESLDGNSVEWREKAAASSSRSAPRGRGPLQAVPQWYPEPTAGGGLVTWLVRPMGLAPMTFLRLWSGCAGLAVVSAGGRNVGLSVCAC
jgi:hypothetical protein